MSIILNLYPPICPGHFPRRSTPERHALICLIASKQTTVLARLKTKCLRITHQDDTPTVLDQYPSGHFILPKHRINQRKFCFRDQAVSFLNGFFKQAFYIFIVSFIFNNRTLNTTSDFIIINDTIQYTYIHTSILLENEITCFNKRKIILITQK